MQAFEQRKKLVAYAYCISRVSILIILLSRHRQPTALRCDGERRTEQEPVRLGGKGQYTSRPESCCWGNAFAPRLPNLNLPKRSRGNRGGKELATAPWPAGAARACFSLGCRRCIGAHPTHRFFEMYRIPDVVGATTFLSCYTDWPKFPIHAAIFWGSARSVRSCLRHWRRADRSWDHGDQLSSRSTGGGGYRMRKKSTTPA